jgi:hypothetical protein
MATKSINKSSMKHSALVYGVYILAFTLIAGCNSSSSDHIDLKAHIDSIQAELDSVYVPGTGEIMNGIVQPHHYKLWLAGQYKNWELAEYEWRQLAGGFKRIVKYHKNTPAATALPMIYPEMDALGGAIREKDPNAFGNHFALLTQTCNTCHQALKYGFNVITVPGTPAFSNQVFK